MTNYTHTLVIVCPFKHAADQSNLSACWSRNSSLSGYDSANRYRDGEPVILKGTVVTQDTLIASQSPPQRHPDDTDHRIDMDAAQRAYDSLVILWPETEEYQWPETIPDDAIIAVVDVPLPVVAERLGLTRPESDSDEL